MDKTLFSYNSLPLLTFIEIYETDDLSLLIIEGEHSAEELNIHWTTIVSKFTKASQGDNAGALFALVQESRGLHRLNTITGCVSLWDFDPEWCKDILALPQIGVKVQTKEKLMARAKNEINLHELRVERNKPEKKEGEDEKTNWWDVIALFAQMENPINIDASRTTLAQFASILKGVSKRKTKKNK